jgi:prophage maintenance system killer protein
MAEANPSHLLGEIDQMLREGVDWNATDTETTLRKVKLLSTVACYLNERLLELYGGHPGDIRGVHLVEQVVGAAFQSFGGEEVHPDHFDKAAMLLRGITQGHPFGDGNKRTGLTLAGYHLDLLRRTSRRELHGGSPTGVVGQMNL